MLHQKIDTSVCLFPNNPLRDYVSEHQDGLAHAASLLAGRRGIRCMTRVVETLSCSYPLTRMPKKDLNDLLAILTLEHVHDCDRDESGYFAEIDPADPIVEDICLLADGLRDVMRWMNIVGTDPTAVV